MKLSDTLDKLLKNSKESDICSAYFKTCPNLHMECKKCLFARSNAQVLKDKIDILVLLGE